MAGSQQHGLHTTGLWDQGVTYLVTMGEGITDVNGFLRLKTTNWDLSTVAGYIYSRNIQPLVTTYCRC